jgi:hypothetical protein
VRDGPGRVAGLRRVRLDAGGAQEREAPLIVVLAPGAARHHPELGQVTGPHLADGARRAGVVGEPHEQLVLEEGEEAQAVDRPDAVHDRDVEAAGQQLRHEVPALRLVPLDPPRRVVAADRASERRGQPVTADRGDAHPQRRPGLGADRAGRGDRLLEDRDGDADTAVELLARRRQHDAARGAVEQADAELGLQPQDPLAERRLRHVELLGRAPEVQLLGDRHERRQQPRVDVSTEHGRIIDTR